MEQIIGRYRDLKRIGGGRLGEVFKAFDPVVGRALAVRLLPEAASRIEAEVWDEARLWSRLFHPHVVSLYETGKEGKRLFLAMELVEGPSVASLLRERRPLAYWLALAAISQAADALDYAHGQGVVHGGIRPSNLLAREDGFVKIVDFGIAGLEFGEAGGTWLLHLAPPESHGSAPRQRPRALRDRLCQVPRERRTRRRPLPRRVLRPASRFHRLQVRVARGPGQ